VAVSRALVLGGCLYAVCGGLDCNAWEDAFDEACTENDCPGKHVMTTAHPGEAVSAVAFFVSTCTSFDGHDFTALVVVHVGSGPLVEEVERAVAAELARTG
jgi:hypothetical protein